MSEELERHPVVVPERLALTSELEAAGLSRASVEQVRALARESKGVVDLLFLFRDALTVDDKAATVEVLKELLTDRGLGDV